MKARIADREWPALHAVWRLGLVTTKAVHQALLEQGHILDRRKAHHLLKSLTEKGYLRARKVAQTWTFVAVVEPEEAFEVLWHHVRSTALDDDLEHVEAFRRVVSRELPP